MHRALLFLIIFMPFVGWAYEIPEHECSYKELAQNGFDVSIVSSAEIPKTGAIKIAFKRFMPRWDGPGRPVWGAAYSSHLGWVVRFSMCHENRESGGTIVVDAKTGDVKIMKMDFEEKITNKFKNENAASGSDASSTRPF